MGLQTVETAIETVAKVKTDRDTVAPWKTEAMFGRVVVREKLSFESGIYICRAQPELVNSMPRDCNAYPR